MRIGDRVLIEPPKEDLPSFVNCGGIPFAGLTGQVIASARNIAPPLDLWLVLFDKDVCGLNVPENCDHDFAGQAQKERDLYTLVEGLIANGKRNQRFLATAFLKIVDPTAGLEPRNNDGRSACFWCGAPTKRVPGVSVNNYDICTRCGK